MAWSQVAVIPGADEVRCMSQISLLSSFYIGTWDGGADGDIYDTDDLNVFNLDQSFTGVKPWCMAQFNGSLFCGMEYVTGTHKAEVWRKDSDSSSWVLDGDLDTGSNFRPQVYQMWATESYLYAAIGVYDGASGVPYQGDAKIYQRDTNGNWTLCFEPKVAADPNEHQAATGVCYKDGYIYVRAQGASDPILYTAAYRYEVSTATLTRVWKQGSLIRHGRMCAGYDKVIMSWCTTVGGIYKWNGATFVLDKAAVNDRVPSAFNDWLYVIAQAGDNHYVYRWDLSQWREEYVYTSAVSNLISFGVFREQPYVGSHHGRIYGPPTDWEICWLFGRGRTADCLDVDTQDASLVRIGAHSGSGFLPTAFEITSDLDHCHAVYEGSSGSVMGIQTEYGDKQHVYFYGWIDGSPIRRALDGVTFSSSGSEFISQVCRNVLVAVNASGSPIALTSAAEVWESVVFNQWHKHGDLSFDPLGADRHPGYFLCMGRYETSGSPIVEMSWDFGVSREQRDMYLPSGAFVSDMAILK